MSGLSFAWPAALAGLLLLPAFAVARWRQRRRDRVPWAPLQYRSPSRPRGLLSSLALPLEVALLAAAVVAIAGPRRVESLELFEDEGIDVMLVLDVSLSMKAEDFPPDRLAAVRRIAGDFLARAGGHRVGIVIFAKDCYVQAPLTTDLPVLGELLEGVGVAAINQSVSGGTAVGDALLLAAEHLDAARVEGRDQAIILLSDGDSNSGVEPALAADYLRHLGTRLYAIGIGGEEPVEVRTGSAEPFLTVLDDAQLRDTAARAGGRYYRASEVAALEAVFSELGHLESSPLSVRTAGIPRPYTPALAFALLLLLILQLTLEGVLLRRPLR